ncbi:hypothetical protein NE237_011555 [Protea cynaroides]|uniref:Uncharacterized protein n=1 Tax=Protea cynaroides TaxID=273540 RepID=A0A9Q0GV63_9MAGN|nr:hypothetical protein NE237_011555 [Protea cynaroides]
MLGHDSIVFDIDMASSTPSSVGDNESSVELGTVGPASSFDFCCSVGGFSLFRIEMKDKKSTPAVMKLGMTQGMILEVARSISIHPSISGDARKHHRLLVLLPSSSEAEKKKTEQKEFNSIEPSK